MSFENIKQPADIESTHVLQQSTDAVASYTKLPTRAAADVVGYSCLWSAGQDDMMYTRAIVNSNTPLTTTDIVEERNYRTLLADAEQSKPDQPVANDALHDAGDNDITHGTIALHQNVLSATELLNRLPSTRRYSDVDVLCDDTDAEQITHDNDLSARIAANENNCDGIIHDNVEMQNPIHPKVSIKYYYFTRCGLSNVNSN
jgi:hypothetical protein